MGSSRVRDQKYQRHPSSAWQASVKSREISGQLSACSGLTLNLAVMKINGAPCVRCDRGRDGAAGYYPLWCESKRAAALIAYPRSHGQ